MSNGKIFYNNIISNAVVSASTSAAGFDAGYLINKNQGVVWRSVSGDDQHIDIKFQSGGVPVNVTVYGVVVLNHNMTGSETFRFSVLGDANRVVTIDKTTGLGLVVTPSGWQASDFRIELDKNSVSSYVQAGEVYLIGSQYQFERNYSWNYSYTKEINRNSRETTSGQIYRKTRFIRKGFNLEFAGINDTQKNTFEDIAESDYICFMPDGAGTRLLYGIVDFSAFTHVYDNYWNATITFTENPK